MKKVLFVATVTSHIKAFHIPYLKFFAEKGYEVHVASKGNEKIEYCDKHFNLQFERFPIKKQNIKVYKELKRIINENEYEIIHCHTPVGGLIGRLASIKARKKFNTKVIYTAHGFHFYKGAPLKNWIIYYPIEKLCSKWTDCLITITNEDYELARRKFKMVKQIEYVNGIGMNIERFKKVLSMEEKENKRKELGILKKDIVFSYVAELNKNKNQILLMKVMKELKKEISNIKLLLIGEGILYNYYKNMIENYELNDNIILLGRRNDINELLSITDIYLASSIREGLPVNIMEAMYKGLPIIAMKNRGHKELIANNENGFLVENEKEFLEKIKIILNNKELQFKMSNISKLKSKEYYLDEILDKMDRIYSI